MNILTENYKLYNGDCLEIMDKLIEMGIKVDAIICDPPYGTTKCRWDNIISFDEMWERLNKLIKPNRAILLFGTEPFSSQLRVSNLQNYRYDWYWHKNKSGNFLTVKYAPHKKIEIISVFCEKKNPTYFPIMELNNNETSKKRMKYKFNDNKVSGAVNLNLKEHKSKSDSEYKYPETLINFNCEIKTVHPTQKPIALMEYLIKTYTNENELILDFTCGSGSTGVACLNCNRRFIGIELEKEYFDIAINRIFENYNN